MFNVDHFLIEHPSILSPRSLLHSKWGQVLQYNIHLFSDSFLTCGIKPLSSRMMRTSLPITEKALWTKIRRNKQILLFECKTGNPEHPVCSGLPVRAGAGRRIFKEVGVLGSDLVSCVLFLLDSFYDATQGRRV
jgi:hypothetical protein